MPQAQTFSSRQSEPTAQMTGEEKVGVAVGSLGLVRAVRATDFFARITVFFTGDAGRRAEHEHEEDDGAVLFSA